MKSRILHPDIPNPNSLRLKRFVSCFTANISNLNKERSRLDNIDLPYLYDVPLGLHNVQITIGDAPEKSVCDNMGYGRITVPLDDMGVYHMASRGASRHLGSIG